MINQNWWFSTLLIKQFKYCPPLNRSIKCDVLIVGGGFSGVSAAAWSAPYDAKEEFKSLGLCGRGMKANKTLRQMSNKKWRG